jgi:hypothetical protein
MKHRIIQLSGLLAIALLVSLLALNAHGNAL